jgi:hypothetical protein
MASHPNTFCKTRWHWGQSLQYFIFHFSSSSIARCLSTDSLADCSCTEALSAASVRPLYAWRPVVTQRSHARRAL